MNVPMWLAWAICGLAGAFLCGALYIIALGVFVFFRLANEIAFSSPGNTGSLTPFFSALLALIGGPILIWRVVTAHIQAQAARRQAEIAQEGHNTGLFTKAVEQLGATRQVTRHLSATGNKDPKAGQKAVSNKTKASELITETEPNLEVRLGAIYALERIARYSERDHWSIMEVLCAYVRDRQNSGEPAPDTERRVDIQAALTVVRRRPPERIELERQLGAFLDLSQANLQGAKLTGATFVGADLTGAHLQKAQLWHANLKDAILKGASLKDAQLSFADLSGANFENAILEGARLEDANLKGATLSNANLQNAILRGANLELARLKDANVQKADLALGRSERRSTNLAWAHLDGADFTRANLEAANFEGASLRSAILKDAILKDANLKGTHLDLVCFRGANLTGANLTGAYLRTSSLPPSVGQPPSVKKGTDSFPSELRGVDFTGANLTGAILEGVKFSYANFKDVNLQGAKLFNADLSHVRLLSSEALALAFGNSNTLLPEGVERPKNWEADKPVTPEGPNPDKTDKPVTPEGKTWWQALLHNLFTLTRVGAAHDRPSTPE
jgi:uncharacterized protein YjbI with pentapeptide repeats